MSNKLVRDSGSFSGSFEGDGSGLTNVPFSQLYIKRTEVSTSLYIPTSTDYILGVTHTTGSPVTIQLDLISNLPSKHFIIKDEGINSYRYNITVLPSGSNSIERTTTYTIAQNGASINIYNDGNNNWYVY